LLQAPEFLYAQVLHAKYSTYGNILDAKPIVGMNYVWRSILQGLEVLKVGMICRIGDGSNVRIWEDPWLPCGVTRRPTTNKGDRDLIMVS
jgi:hypothetical protein